MAGSAVRSFLVVGFEEECALNLINTVYDGACHSNAVMGNFLQMFLEPLWGLVAPYAVGYPPIFYTHLSSAPHRHLVTTQPSAPARDMP